MTTTLVIVSDLHVNSTAGLCTPVVNRESGSYHAHRPQRELWESWLDFCGKAKEAPGRKVVIINGDAAELDTKRRTYELITPNKAEVMAVIPEVIEPLIKIVDSVYIIRGTPAHTGKGAWLEEAIAHDLTNSAKQGTAASWYHLRAVVEGARPRGAGPISNSFLLRIGNDPIERLSPAFAKGAPDRRRAVWPNGRVSPPRGRRSRPWRGKNTGAEKVMPSSRSSTPRESATP